MPFTTRKCHGFGRKTSVFSAQNHPFQAANTAFPLHILRKTEAPIYVSMRWSCTRKTRIFASVNARHDFRASYAMANVNSFAVATVRKPPICIFRKVGRQHSCCMVKACMRRSALVCSILSREAKRPCGSRCAIAPTLYSSDPETHGEEMILHKIKVGVQYFRFTLEETSVY